MAHQSVPQLVEVHVSIRSVNNIRQSRLHIAESSDELPPSYHLADSVVLSLNVDMVQLSQGWPEFLAHKSKHFSTVIR